MPLPSLEPLLLLLLLLLLLQQRRARVRVRVRRGGRALSRTKRAAVRPCALHPVCIMRNHVTMHTRRAVGLASCVHHA